MVKDWLKKYWPLLLIYFVVLAIYFPIFSLYFVQDDFFHLKMAQATTISDFFGFFSPRNLYGYAFYRPLTIQVFYFLTRSFFGLQPPFFHSIAFIFFLANLFLVFKIIKKLTQNRNLGFLTALLYGINASNLGSLAYLGAFQEVAMAFFFFLTFYLYLKKKKVSSLVFLLSLLSRENAVILPLILMAYEFLLGKREWKRTLPFWLVLGIYGLLRFGVPPIGSDVSVYQPVFTPMKIFNGYFWYWFWGLGLPEMLIDFIGPGLRINPNLLAWYGKEMAIIFGITFLFLVLLLMGALKISKKDKKKAAFFLIWFLIGLLPVIFWPWHKFSYYLTMPLLGLIALIVLLLRNLSKPFLFLAASALVIISLTTISLSWRTYWVITRARIARGLVVDLLEKYPRLPTGAVLYFQNDPKYPQIAGWGNSSTQAYYALSGANAAQVIYDDFSLKVYYEDFGMPSEEKLYPIVAKIVQ